MLLPWLTILLVVLVGPTATLGFQCPETPPGCACQPSHSGDFEINCPTGTDTAFVVNFQPKQYIQIKCLNSPKWSDFQLSSLGPAADVQSLYFRMCGLPTEFTLGDIPRKLGVKRLERLAFQSFGNLSQQLTRDQLRGFTGLKELVLSSNSLTNLEEDLFADLGNLTWLDLRENKVNLSVGIFEHTPELRTLELGHNMMGTIQPGVFDPLTKLVLLNVWRNNLTDIPNGVFDRLKSLKSLDLNANLLKTLPAGIFDNLESLETLNLFGNNFTSLPADLLQRNKKLSTLKLFNNRCNMTTLPGGFLANLPELKVVRLWRNGLQQLPRDLFWGSPMLANVSLDRNRLRTLPVFLFKDAKNLRILELGSNDIQSLPDEIFANTPELTSLDLSRNHISSISSELFTGLSKLEILNMEANELKTIDAFSFQSLKSLRIARFSNNYLTLNTSAPYLIEYGRQSPFHDCLNLEELYLARNNITEIFSDWTFSSVKLKILDLKYNNISHLAVEDIQFISSSLTVDLTHNNIRHIQLQHVEELAAWQSKPRDVIVLVADNPIVCDCQLYEFLRYLEGEMHPFVQNYFHIVPGELACAGPDWLEEIKVTSLKSKSLKCIVANTEDDRRCPNRCSCWETPASQSYTVDCSHRNISALPKDIANLPGHRLELNFTGNSLKQMPVISELQLFNGSLTKLLLSNNNISNVTLSGLSTTIEVLELHNNNISRLDVPVMQYLKNSSGLRSLTLHGNPWICDCEARDFLNFIQTTPAVRARSMGITCRGMDVPLLKMTATDLCPVETVMIVGTSLAIALAGLIIGALAAIYYRYQREIKVWLYAHQSCLWLVTEDELDKGKLYDAFISYSHKDEEFVVQELVNKLENGPRPFKLCLHYRDWVPGDWIPAQIARSVEESRRTIVVLSPDFLESVWGRMEFRAAHSQALSEGRARVILILYGDIGPTDDLDPELKAYISMNTYVKWGDPWFWDKLRYALPHPPELTRRAIKRNIFERHQPCITINNDKKELIYPQNGVETPPAASTPPADSVKVFVCEERIKVEVKEDQPVNGQAKVVLSQPEGKDALGRIQCTTV